MKKFILISAIIFYYVSIKGQDKYDNIWLLNPDQTRKITRLHWNKNLTIDTSTIPIRSEITVGDPNASICDKNGNLKFYSNGCAIAGSDYKIIPNGKQINPGWVHHEWCYDDSTNPYPASDNILFLPHTTDSNRYYLFHTARSDDDLVVLALPFNRFLYTEIDASQGKTGSVIKKNILLAKDTLSEVGVKACKHANGIDWWVIVPTTFPHSYHRALLTKDSVIYIGKQKIGNKYGYTYKDWAGQACFSPNGKKYIRSSPQNGTYIFDFDRCTGLLSNPIFIDTLRQRFYHYTGVGVSPNSRFLYLTVLDALYQFDLEADNIPKSMIKIADMDNFLNERGDRVNFYKCQLAPDNKIYVGSKWLMDWLSIIHKPNEKGLACDFQQHDFKLPWFYIDGLPNMPHYRMPKLEDVDCSIKENTSNVFISLYPNPNHGQVHIKVLNEVKIAYTWELYDELGRPIFTHSITNIISDVELPAFLKNGLYFWRVFDENKQIGQGKLVVLD